MAFVWLATAAGVLHPYYREIGADYLTRLGLPVWLMYAACTFEGVLAIGVALLPARRWITALQATMVLFFTATLAVTDPALMVNPFGMLTKNVPLVCVLVAAYWVNGDGWQDRSLWILRAGLASIWITEGLLPKIVFQQPMELAIVANSGLVPINPRLFLVLLGGLQIAAGVAVVLFRRKPLRVVLSIQFIALLVLPLLVSWQLPLLWVHPFGPLIKNVPILAGTAMLWLRCLPSS